MGSPSKQVYTCYKNRSSNTGKFGIKNPHCLDNEFLWDQVSRKCVKSFPNQTADVVKIARSVQALHELELEHDAVSSLAFGREITRRGIRWPANFPPDGDIEARMDADEAAEIPPFQAGSGWTGYFEHSAPLDYAVVTDLGEQTAELGHDLTQLNSLSTGINFCGISNMRGAILTDISCELYKCTLASAPVSSLWRWKAKTMVKKNRQGLTN